MALGDLAGLAIVLVIVTITLSMGALVLSETQASSAIVENGSAYNNTKEGLSSIDTTAGFLPVVAIVVVAAVIIGIVAKSFQGQGGM